ncbi:MAG: RHS repeat-associated core domain-containing protein, partial [Anaerolineae bacterium]
MELPDGKAVTYTYNARGELTDLALADWETQSTTFSYDHMGRLQSAAQLNGPQTSYHYDEAGHLLDLLHEDGSSNTLAHFEYAVDERGNRISATETLAQPSSGDLVLEITYDYDALARLIGADYTIGTDTREHDFTYDLAGNRTQEVVTLNSTPTTTNYTYDIANRLSQIGGQSVDYDNAGRLTDDGTLTYTWDRANRLLDAGGSSYRYNGVGQRVDQTVSSVVTEYLLDVQPGLWQVLAATTGSDVTRFVHGPRGLHLQQQPNTDWVFPLHDGLNSLRSMVDEALDPLHLQNFDPYGNPFGVQGSMQSVFGFTGEPTDQNDLVYLRARYYSPVLAAFPSLDPLEGDIPENRSLNRYGYVQGNPANLIDPSGLIGERPPSGCQNQQQATCIGFPSGINSLDTNVKGIDAIDVYRRTLYAHTGVALSTACGQSVSWASYISSFTAAVLDIERKIGRSFRSVFGELEFRLHHNMPLNATGVY